MSYFPEGAHKLFRTRNPLSRVVGNLPPSARSAMYAAAEKGVIKRGTWNGCAWNAAGAHHGLETRSVNAAARQFNCSPQVVSDFIQVWDRLRGSNTSCTSILKDAIEKVGITQNRPKGTLVVAGRAFTGSETRFKEQLKSVTDIRDMPGMEDATIDASLMVLNA